MSEGDVTRTVGQPDEVRPLYEPRVKNGKQIGHTWWYVVSADSLTDPKGSVLRVSLDQQGRVTSIDHWGLEPGS